MTKAAPNLIPGPVIFSLQCGPLSRCYAMEHLLKLKVLKEASYTVPLTKGKQRLGVYMTAKTKGKSHGYAFKFCPWCGGRPQ